MTDIAKIYIGTLAAIITAFLLFFIPPLIGIDVIIGVAKAFFTFGSVAGI